LIGLHSSSLLLRRRKRKKKETEEGTGEQMGMQWDRKRPLICWSLNCLSAGSKIKRGGCLLFFLRRLGFLFTLLLFGGHENRTHSSLSINRLPSIWIDVFAVRQFINLPIYLLPSGKPNVLSFFPSFPLFLSVVSSNSFKKSSSLWILCFLFVCVFVFFQLCFGSSSPVALKKKRRTTSRQTTARDGGLPVSHLSP